MERLRQLFSSPRRVWLSAAYLQACLRQNGAGWVFVAYARYRNGPRGADVRAMPGRIYHHHMLRGEADESLSRRDAGAYHKFFNVAPDFIQTGKKRLKASFALVA